jgi:hypothetical protein
LRHVLTGQPGEQPEAAYIMSAFPWIVPEWRGVRTERYTYAKTHNGTLFLYDNLVDPYQLNNLGGKPEAAGIEKDLAELTREMAEDIGDSFETWEVINARMEKTRQAWLETYGEAMGIKS